MAGVEKVPMPLELFPATLTLYSVLDSSPVSVELVIWGSGWMMISLSPPPVWLSCILQLLGGLVVLAMNSAPYREMMRVWCKHVEWLTCHSRDSCVGEERGVKLVMVGGGSPAVEGECVCVAGWGEGGRD